MSQWETLQEGSWVDPLVIADAIEKDASDGNSIPHEKVIAFLPNAREGWEALERIESACAGAVDPTRAHRLGRSTPSSAP